MSQSDAFKQKCMKYMWWRQKDVWFWSGVSQNHWVVNHNQLIKGKSWHIALHAYTDVYILEVLIWWKCLYERIVYVVVLFVLQRLLYNRDSYITEMNVWQRCLYDKSIYTT